MTLIQRCALTVQLQPSIAHIPGGALSTLPTRNTKQHRDTDHTIARSRFGPLGRTLLPPPIVIGDPPPSIFHRRTKGRLVPPGSIAFDSSTRRSFLTSFTAHRYARAPLSSGSRSSSIDPFSSSLSHLSRNSNIPDPTYFSIRTKAANPSIRLLFQIVVANFSSAKTRHRAGFFERHARLDERNGREKDEKTWDGKLVESMCPPRDI